MAYNASNCRENYRISHTLSYNDRMCVHDFILYLDMKSASSLIAVTGSPNTFENIWLCLLYTLHTIYNLNFLNHVYCFSLFICPYEIT